MREKTLEEYMEEANYPETIEKNARYHNARDAVSWAYKMAEKDSATPQSIVEFARVLIPQIEADLNRTLEVLNGTKGT